MIILTRQYTYALIMSIILDKGGDVKEVIGNNIKKMREIAGISQEVFAEKLGISRATLSAIENGHVAIDSTKLLQIAQILGRPVSDFFEQKAEALALLYRAAEDALAPQAP